MLYKAISPSVEFSVNSNVIYLAEDSVGVTYYQLNNSAAGSDYYTTMASVYYSIPYYYFEMADGDFLNDRFIYFA